MPQFKYSFRWAATLYPVFIQLVASVFVATGLLPNNHPAMRYGSPDVKAYSFGDLVGEAWYHLRRSRATPRQWAMYFSVLIMIFCFATAIVGVTGRVFLGVGAVAEAQIFTLPNDTSLNALSSTSPSSLFDKRMEASQMSFSGGGYNDWGLFMLDKIVRESAMTPQRGGKLQNAFSAIILTYNTAITVVAAVMIFWIILSLVVDTAKTGVLGGGRHNMVWAPIRIVFALGIMIPLGSAGYSSGQYCVMKLAEWGSNLGTNGWISYVNALSGNNDLLAPVMPGGSAELVNAVAQMRLCQVLYNSYVVQSTQNADWPNNLVGARNTWSEDGTTLIHALTNTHDQSLCGALKIRVPGGDSYSDTTSAVSGWTSSGSEPIMGQVPPRPGDSWSGSTILDDMSSVSVGFANGKGPTGVLYNAISGPSPFVAMGEAIALAQAQGAMRKAIITGTINDLTSQVEPQMIDFACTYAARHFPGGAAAVSAAVDVDESASPPSPGSTICSNINACNAPAIPAAGTAAVNNYDPDFSCHSAAIQALATDLKTNLLSSISSFTNWLTNPPPGGCPPVLSAGCSAMTADMVKYGWASAGAFYNKITSMNATVQDMGQPSITYQPGKLGSAAAACSSSSASVGDCSPTGINYETAMVMERYANWYEEYSNSGKGASWSNASNPNGDVGLDQSQNTNKSNGISKWKLLWAMLKGGASAVADLMIDVIFGGQFSRGGLIVNLVGSVTDNTLPLANLAKLGTGLIVAGGGVMLLASIFQGAIGILTVAAGTAFANSAIFAFITATATALITSGMVLTYYVPIMPFLRSAFATLTWMVSIFEAVCMVPIAALAHLTTEGEGLAAGARVCWILWLNVLTRPILYVMGFVGAFIVYNAFICYFTTAFEAAEANASPANNIVSKIVSMFFDTTVYVGTAFAAANSVFKMVDIIPNALMRWMPGGSVDHSFDDGASAAQGYAQTAASTMSRGATAVGSDLINAQAGKAGLNKGANITQAPPAPAPTGGA